VLYKTADCNVLYLGNGTDAPERAKAKVTRSNRVGRAIQNKTANLYVIEITNPAPLGCLACMLGVRVRGPTLSKPLRQIPAVFGVRD
jgi:hypothetical protein